MHEKTCMAPIVAANDRPEFFYYLIYGNFFLRYRVGGRRKKIKKLQLTGHFQSFFFHFQSVFCNISRKKQ